MRKRGIIASIAGNNEAYEFGTYFR